MLVSAVLIGRAPRHIQYSLDASVSEAFGRNNRRRAYLHLYYKFEQNDRSDMLIENADMLVENASHSHYFKIVPLKTDKVPRFHLRRWEQLRSLVFVFAGQQFIKNVKQIIETVFILWKRQD